MSMAFLGVELEAAYQLFHERDERLQVLFQSEVELVPLFEVDRDCVILAKNAGHVGGNVLFRISPSSSMVSSLPALISPPSYL
jgi:hypothetical protein